MGSFGWAIVNTASTTAYNTIGKMARNNQLHNSHTKLKLVSDQTLHEGEPMFPVLTSVSRSASSLWTLVLREVRATFSRVSLSISWVTFTSSKVARAFSFAASKPSAMILGWRPLKINVRTLIRCKLFLMRFHFWPLFYLWHIKIRLFQEFSNDEDVWGGSISCDIILCCGNFCNEWCCGMLNLLQNKNPK